MSIHLGRGFNRLFLVLTLGWAVYCAVVFPLQWLYKGQARADAQRTADYANCGQLAGTSLGGEPCFNSAEDNWRASQSFFAFKNFWMIDAVFWRMEIPAIVLPPLFVYALALLSRWIWRGFRPRMEGRA